MSKSSDPVAVPAKKPEVSAEAMAQMELQAMDTMMSKMDPWTKHPNHAVSPGPEERGEEEEGEWAPVQVLLNGRPS